MGLSKIRNEDQNKEKEILNQLFQYSDKFESTVFNSGAGSGKTYALVECLKYIVEQNRDRLKHYNQKIACITYTNVAANNIKAQIGASDIVDITTIHDRVWYIISGQKSALLNLHIEKINSAIEELDEQLSNKDDYKKYRELDKELQEHFFQLMIENKTHYNKAYNLKAKEFKDAMPDEIRREYAELISNVSKFKGLVDRLFRRKRYSDCLEKISRGEKGYREVYYDPMFNRDRLDKMRISHDTLLDYGLALIQKYPKMRQIVIDSYPYILIDEYQDTANTVVAIMNAVEQYAKEINHEIFIAYFGDSVQNIYDTGVGTKLKQLHSNLKTVTKLYNRRSYTEIIDVANKVRNDDINQKSIYLDSEGGSVELYCGKQDAVREFIDLCVEQWNIDIKNPLHCLFATNQMVADYSGFSNVYRTFKNAGVYQGIGYKQLNTELLSHDIIRLGKVQSLLYRLMKLYTEVREEKQALRNILPTDEYRNMSFSDLKKLIELLQSLNGNTLDELLVDIFGKYKTSRDKTYKFIIERIFDIDEISYEGMLKYLLHSLYDSYDEEEETKQIVGEVLNLRIEEVLCWFHYVNRDEGKEIYYHTFHSTKGLEYENVIIVLGKDFGQDKGLFELFFKEYGEDISQDLPKYEQYERGRNILYVAVTRAIKNLRILYIDDLEEVRHNIEKIFGKAETFPIQMT